MKQLFFITVLVGLFASSCGDGAKTARQEKEEPAKRLVSLNGTITEIIYALNSENELVAVDVTSTYPEEVSKLTNLGHVRAVTAESILGSKPTHVLAFEDELNPALKSQLEKAGVKVVTFKREFTVESTKTVLKEVAEWLDKKETAASLIQTIEKDIAALTIPEKRPKVLFVYARGTGTMMVAGAKTQMESMIRLAGGVNAVSGFDDFKPLTAEAVVAANPDVILMFDSGMSSLNDAGGVLAIPGVSSTTAGKNKAVITMDGQLLSGFGPRLGKAIAELNSALKQLK